MSLDVLRSKLFISFCLFQDSCYLVLVVGEGKSNIQ